jgi:NTE family protein
MQDPWQTADQVMGIMMKRLNDRQMSDADVIITPAIGRHLSSSFSGLDTLITRGDESTERQIGAIMTLYTRRSDSLAAVAGGPVLAAPVTVERGDATIPDSLWERWQLPAGVGPVPLYDLECLLGRIYATGDFDSVWAAVRTGPAGTQLSVCTRLNPTLRSVTFSGNKFVPDSDLNAVFAPILGRLLNNGATTLALEGLTRLYRMRGFSLAHVDSVTFDRNSGALSLDIDEGVITRIDVQGGIRTQDAFILQEFPLGPGEVFQLDKAKRGLSRLSGTTLFEYVYLEITSLSPEIALTIRIKERPSQLLRLGLRADDERQLQGLLDIRDENWHGTGMQLGISIAGGQRNGDIILGFGMQRLFNTSLTFGVSAFHKTFDSYVYADAAKTHPNRWDRERLGEFRDIRYGFTMSFGSLLERLGNATAELVWQNVRLVNVQDLSALDERNRLVLVRLATLVDTKDAYPFPRHGVGFRMSYEFSLEGLGSEVGYNSLHATYESYTSWGKELTFHPRFTLGFADNTMPLAQQFRMGGRDSFFGLREDDRRGRQMILVNMEVRYKLPIQLLFETYVRARYDLGTISAIPEEIKFSSLLHGVGVELALATPVGPAVFGLGKAFYVSPDPTQPLQQGPFMAYVMIGYQL